MKTDEELLLEIAKGSSKAFELLFGRYKNWVFGLSMRLLKTKALAEENSQEVWMKVINSSEHFKSKGSAKSWILTITKNHALNTIRKNGWEEPMPTDSSEVLKDNNIDLETYFSNAQTLNQLKDSIAQLPDRQRVALILWLDDEMSYDDLARQLDLNINAVKVLLFRAKENVKKMMESKIG